MHEEFEEIPGWVALLTMINYALLTVLGHIRDFLRDWKLTVSYIKTESAKMKVCCCCCCCTC